MGCGVVVMAGLVEGEVTPEQLQIALGNQTGLVWTVGGETADGWRLPYDQVLLLSSTVPGVKYTLGTTVTGPGVLELRTRRDAGKWEASIWVDEVKSGGDLIATGAPDRVEVGEGPHEIRWEFIRSATGPGQYAAVSVPEGKWESFSILPLSSDSETGVTLSGPWIGQDRWHGGDGGAAWSGIRLPAAAGVAVPKHALRADFEGPGVLRFASFSKGTIGRFHLDGQLKQPWTETGRWLRSYHLMGPGTHFAEWEAGQDVSMDRRDADLVVDEVSLTPEVDAAVALDTPGWVWNVAEGEGRAFGAEVPGASGGSAMVFPYMVSISTTVTEGGILRLRKLQDFQSGPRIFCDGVELDERRIEIKEEEDGNVWHLYAVVVPAGGGTVRIQGAYSPFVPAVIDQVEWMTEPGSLFAAVGMEEDAFTTGGDGVWGIEPFLERGRYGIRTILDGPESEAWMDLPVTGPAEVTFDFSNHFSSAKVAFWLDGLPLAETTYESRERVTIEVPEGPHVIRARVAGDEQYGDLDGRTLMGGISGITIRGLPEGGKIIAALDDSRGWISHGGWAAGSELSHDGVDALRPVAGGSGPGDSSLHMIGAVFEGPGYLKFQTYFEDAGLDGSPAYLRWTTAVAPAGRRSRHDGPAGWREESVWFPPGRHSIHWQAYGRPAELERMAIDEVGFTASETLPVAGAFPFPGVEWDGGEEAWTAVIKAPGGAPVAVSPVLDHGGTSRFGAMIQGQGALTFRWRTEGSGSLEGELWVNGVKTRHLVNAWSYHTPVTVVLPAGEPVRVEWVARSQGAGAWLEVEEIEWTPWPESSLAAALDSPDGVIWTTAADRGFTGRPVPGSWNGSAAYVMLDAGEETWLQATVEGPGLIDFWLIDAPGGSRPWFYQVEWELWIDGERVGIRGPEWEPVLVSGEGTHTIKWVFRHPGDSGEVIAGAVDRVSWVPLAAGGEDGWTASDPEAFTIFSDGGRSGAGMVVFRPAVDEVRWVERTVTGPGVLEWDQAAGNGEVVHAAGELRVEVDGVCRLPVEAGGGWFKYRLGVPEGVHAIRWTSDPEGYLHPDEEDGTPYNRFWKISGMHFSPGVSALAEAVDDPEGMWLEIGDAEGILVAGEDTWDGIDAWRPGAGTGVFFCNTGGESLRVGGMISKGDGNDPRWRRMRRWVEPGEVVPWVAGWPYGTGWVIDGFTAEAVPVMPLHEALEVEGEIPAHGWIGIQEEREAFDGEDCGWSWLTDGDAVHTATLAVDGPARVRFRWKAGGTGTLAMRLDGAWLPVAAPGETWREVEFEIAGDGVLEWVHAAAAGTSEEEPGEAWIDAVSVVSVPEKTLDEVLGGSGLVFQSSPDEAGEDVRWKAVGYRDGQGVWRENARVVAGGSALKTMVTGPVLVSFRVRCDEVPIPQAESSGAVAPRLIVMDPWPTMKVTGRYVSVKVGDREVLRAASEPSGEWEDHLFHVPAGEHEVSWQLQAHTMYMNGGAHLPEWQAWLGGVALKSPLVHYDEWREAHLPDGTNMKPEQDADGDGYANFLEYAYGTDPGDTVSRPREVFGTFGDEPGFSIPGNRPTGGDPTVIVYPPARSYSLHIPRLPAHVSGVLEASDDLETWSPSGVRLRSYPLGEPGGWIVVVPRVDYDSGIYQVYDFPIEEGSKFFRLKLDLPEEDD